MSNTNAYKPGYKHTPLGWIPDDWNALKLSDILTDAKLGGNYENSEANNGVPVMKMGNLNRGNVSLEKIQYLPESEQYNSADILKEGDLLFNTRNTLELVGKVAVWRNELPFALYNSNILRLTFDDKQVASNWYMNLVFNSSYGRRQLRGFATGTTSVAAIYSRDLEHFIAFLPSLSEQNKITSILSTWDEAIQKTQQLIQQLKQRNKGLFKQLLKPRTTWREYRLSDLFDRVTRRNTEINTNVVTISAQRGFVRQSDFFNKQVASEILDNYFLVEKGEFCYNKSYSNGYDWGATKRLNDFDKAVVTTLYICFRLKDDTKHSGDFFEYFFESGLLEVGLSKIAHEGGRAHGLLNVTPSDFFNLKIRVPNKPEQIAIHSVLLAATNEHKIHEQQLATLQQQKKGLMQKLLSGEVRVKTI